MKKIYTLLLIFYLAVLNPLCPVRAVHTTEYFSAEVTRVQNNGQQVVVKVGAGESAAEYTANTFAEKYIFKPNYKTGDRLVVTLENVNGKIVAVIIERDRTIPYMILGATFVLAVLIIGRLKGAAAIMAMVGSFLLLTNLTIPQIITGVDPVLISILSGLIIVPLTFYLTHGFSQQTTLAAAATMCALILTGLLSTLFTYLTQLTGYASEEAAGLALRFGEALEPHNLLIAGMIISSMGILDDVTISQIGIVHALSKVKPNMRPNQLFMEAMKLGRDHIGSLVNTLILVYVGAALPMFLLIYKTEVPLWVVIQREAIAEEIVRTLVASIGIIASVPIATLFGIKWGRKHVGFLQKERLL